MDRVAFCRELVSTFAVLPPIVKNRDLCEVGDANGDVRLMLKKLKFLKISCLSGSVKEMPTTLSYN
jgi:hypothetical protein